MLFVLLGVVKTVFFYIVLLLLVFWGWFQWKHHDLLRAASQLPSLYYPLPFLGHAPYTLLGLENLTYWALRMCKKAVSQGLNTICFWCGPIPLIMLNGQEDIQKILNSSSTSEKSQEYDFMSYSMGEGLLTAPWKVWKVTRRHINPLFHPRNLDQLTPLFNLNCRELVADMSGHVGKGPFNVLHHTTDLALKTVCQIIFGESMECDTKSEEFRGLKTVVERIPEIAIERCLRVWLRLDVIFHFFYKKELKEMNNLWKKFSETPLKRARLETEKKLNEENYFQDPRDSFPRLNGETVNLLDVYSVLQKNYPNFTDRELKAEMITLYATGTDSISVLTATCLTLLGCHSDVQEKLYEEIMDVVGVEEGVSCEDLARMSFLDQVYKETLRWASVIPFIARRTTKEVVLSSCKIPAGCTVVLCLFGLHNNPRTFPDPERFDPDRFSLSNSELRGKNAFIPYSGGPRNCIGKRYAEIMLKVFVIQVLRKYRVTTEMNIQKMKRKLMVTLVSTEGYHISLHSRG